MITPCLPSLCPGKPVPMTSIAGSRTTMPTNQCCVNNNDTLNRKSRVHFGNLGPFFRDFGSKPHPLRPRYAIYLLHTIVRFDNRSFPPLPPTKNDHPAVQRTGLLTHKTHSPSYLTFDVHSFLPHKPTNIYVRQPQLQPHSPHLPPLRLRPPHRRALTPRHAPNTQPHYSHGPHYHSPVRDCRGRGSEF